MTTEVTTESAEEVRALREQVDALTKERDRLQRACDEGLPREVIHCPKCHRQHLEWFRHDAPGIDGRKRPHHTHRCYHCGHEWDLGRWSFGAEKAANVAVLDAIEALRPLAVAAFRDRLGTAEEWDPDVDTDVDGESDEAPHIALTYAIEKTSTPWQANVSFDGAHGVVVLVAGACAADPLLALQELRETIENGVA